MTTIRRARAVLEGGFGQIGLIVFLAALPVLATVILAAIGVVCSMGPGL